MTRPPPASGRPGGPDRRRAESLKEPRQLARHRRRDQPRGVQGRRDHNDNDGIREDGDDIVASDANSPQNTAHLGADFYRFNGGASNQSAPVINSISAWGAVGTTGVFEIRHELNSTDNAHDFSIVPTRTVGMIAQVSLETDPVGSDVYLHTLKPSFTTYCQLTIAKKTTSVTCP